MKTVYLNLGGQPIKIKVPVSTVQLGMTQPTILSNPAISIRDALRQSTSGPSFASVIKRKIRNKPDARIVIVISDNTRPVPYRGDKGILWPIIDELLACGISSDQILVLVGTGTHRPVTESELCDMLDPRIFAAGISIKNHDCDDQENLIYLGKTTTGGEMYLNKEYMEADLKILTGLVESHFMAGASGGRKSVCPGLIGRQSTYGFHGAQTLSCAQARDLVLKDNPCHEEALNVALRTGVDYIVNVTLNHEFELTGIFTGDMEKAHQQAVEHVKGYVAIPLEQEYDIVVTHAGFVGINHYQAAKAGVVSIPALKPNGQLIIIANTTDQDQVGSLSYRTTLQLLKLIGADKFNKLVLSPDWTFIPEQWQVQMWAKVLKKTSQRNLVYFSPSMPEADYCILPSHDGNLFLPESQRYGGDFSTISEVVEIAIAKEMDRIRVSEGREATIVFLTDGPYGIPINAK